MQYTQLGKEQIPLIALGTWSWGTGINGGQSIFGNELKDIDLKPVFDEAIANGFTLWDTAAVYGLGASEEILGKFIEGHPEVQISTKFTPMPFLVKASMKRSAERSMARLGVKTLDIYWIHEPSNIKKWTSTAVELVKEGMVKHVGVSNHSLEQVIKADKILKDAGLKLSAVQNHYSLLYRKSEHTGILEWCKENDAVFFAYMVLEQGALTGCYCKDNPFPRKTRRGKTYNKTVLKALEPLIKIMKDLAKKYRTEPAVIPIAWSIAKGTVPIIGVTKVQHVAGVLSAMDVKLSEEDIAKLERAAEETGVVPKAGWEK